VTNVAIQSSVGIMRDYVDRGQAINSTYKYIYTVDWINIHNEESEMCRQFVMISKELMLEMLKDNTIDYESAKRLLDETEKRALHNQVERVKGPLCIEENGVFTPALELVFAKQEDLYMAKSHI